MENASLVGLSRQIALQRELDVVAYNVANLNSTGYKADKVVFHEHLMPVARANQFRGGDRQLSFVQDRATWLDLGQGPVQQTGNPLDVAVSDNAFLTVQTPRGERYTRNGALQINSAGQLVTSEGLAVLAVEVEVEAEGALDLPLGGGVHEGGAHFVEARFDEVVAPHEVDVLVHAVAGLRRALVSGEPREGRDSVGGDHRH